MSEKEQKIPDEFEHEFIEQGHEIIRFRQKHEEDGEGGGCAVLFMLVWLTGWTAGCLTMLIMAIIHLEILLFLFMIPFWAVEIFVLFLFYSMVKKEEFIFKKSELGINIRVFFLTFRKNIVKSEISYLNYDCLKDQVIIGIDDKELKVFRSTEENSKWLGETIAEWAGKELKEINSVKRKILNRGFEYKQTGEVESYSQKTELRIPVLIFLFLILLLVVGLALFTTFFPIYELEYSWTLLIAYPIWKYVIPAVLKGIYLTLHHSEFSFDSETLTVTQSFLFKHNILKFNKNQIREVKLTKGKRNFQTVSIISDYEYKVFALYETDITEFIGRRIAEWADIGLTSDP